MAVLDPRFSPKHVAEVEKRLVRRFGFEVEGGLSLEEITSENQGLAVDGRRGGFLHKLVNLNWGGQSEKEEKNGQV